MGRPILIFKGKFCSCYVLEQKGVYHELRGGKTVQHEENSDTVLRCVNQNFVLERSSCLEFVHIIQQSSYTR